jgi:glucokinase
VRRALGIDLGGTKALGCLVDGAGSLLRGALRRTGRRTSPADVLGLVADIAAEIERAAGSFDAVGVGFPGLVDAAGGVVRSSVILDGWRDFPLEDRVAGVVGVPCVVDNDVNAAAVAELSARGSPPGAMLFVAVGTGIGGALAIDGRLWRCASGAAGEIGNTTVPFGDRRCWCGRRCCLNTVASGAAIERDLGLAPGSLVDHAADAGPALRAAAALAGSRLGVGIADAMNLINPSFVVLGGGVCRLEGFFEAAEKSARAEAFAEVADACRIERARAGYTAGAVGAALLALDASGRAAGC